MRILQVTSCFYPAWAYGGPVAVAFHLSKELARRGHEVVVYTTDTIDRNTRQRTKYLEIDGVKVYYFRNISNKLASRNLFCAPGMLFQLKKEIRHFDIVHLQDYRSFQNIVVHHYAKKYGVPYVLQAHGSLSRTAGKRRLKKLYDSSWGYRLLRDAYKVVALTETESEQYKSMGVSKGRIEIVSNGIDLSEFENLPKRGEFREKHGLNNNQKIILYLGRIHQTKGIDLLVKTFARLAENLNEAKLVIVGPDDGYLPALKALIKESKIEEKVLLTGSLYGGERLGAFVDADVFVTPSFLGFPVTFIEACATGTPIVTTKNGDNLDWIHNQVGYVTEYDENQLAPALAKILNNTDIAKLFQEKGQKITKERFNWSEIAKQVEGLYLECLQGSVNSTVPRGATN